MELLQLRAPMASWTDKKFIQEVMKSRVLFPSIVGDEHRRMILNNLQRVPNLVPSLFSFFEDVKYLSLAREVLQKLIESPTQSIYDGLREAFSSERLPVGHLEHQRTESSFVSHTGSTHDQFEIGYKQLWLYALRHLWSLTIASPRKGKLGGGDPQRHDRQDSKAWHELGVLAQRLGFDNGAIQHLVYAEVAERSDHDEGYSSPKFTTDEGECVISERCGIPFRKSDEHDRKHLFWNALQQPCDRSSEGITSLFARRSFFFAFFGHSENTSPLHALAMDLDMTTSSTTTSGHTRRQSRAMYEASPSIYSQPENVRAMHTHFSFSYADIKSQDISLSDTIHLPSLSPSPPGHIVFLVHETGDAREKANDDKEVKRLALMYTRKGMCLFNNKGRTLRPDHCFEATKTDDPRTVHVVRPQASAVNQFLISQGVGTGIK